MAMEEITIYPGDSILRYFASDYWDYWRFFSYPSEIFYIIAIVAAVAALVHAFVRIHKD